MDNSPPLRRGRPVHRGANERVAECDLLSESEEAVGLDVSHPLGRATERLGCAPPQQRAAARLRRREQQQQARVIGEVFQPRGETLLDPPGQSPVPSEPEPSGQLCRGQPLRQLQQREWVPASLEYESRTRLLVEQKTDRGAQEGIGCPVAKPTDLQ